MNLSHPFQQLTPETFHWLMRWSRILFWVVLALYAYIQRTTMPRKSTPASIIATPDKEKGALGFWVGFDYLFMLAYTLFFSICCVWGANLFAPGSLFFTAGIALAWAMVPQLLIDMSENWCMWQIAVGNPGERIKSLLPTLYKAKKPLFFLAALYSLVVSLLYWTNLLP